MRDPPLILIADDNADNLAILEARLAAQKYALVTARDGEEALNAAKEHRPDVALLDVMMPKLDGFELCRRLKADKTLPFMPIVLVTAKAATQDVVTGLDAGADDYLTKPVDHAALTARLRSILRMKALHDTVQNQAQRLEEQSAELAGWNKTLSAKVDEQVLEIERVSRLKRFLPPQIAELVISSGVEKALETHRREIAVVFADLRGFTMFAEVAEPEDVMAVLGGYHAAAGALIEKYQGTLERFLGDGLMILFNDPLPCPDPAARAVKLAVELRAKAEDLAKVWEKRGHTLGLGIGVAQGYATLGRIGFEGRFDYTAIGTVVNQASRLCAEAKPGEILINRRAFGEVEALVTAESLGDLALRGLRQPVGTFRLLDLR